ncbi:uncharacterized protein PHA67_009653 isoform 2-T2 [Liasis olivaceus]
MPSSRPASCGGVGGGGRGRQPHGAASSAGKGKPGLHPQESRSRQARQRSGTQPARLRLSACFWDLAGPDPTGLPSGEGPRAKNLPRGSAAWLSSTSVPALQKKLSSQPHLPRGQMDAKLQFPACTTAGTQAPVGRADRGEACADLVLSALK